MKNQGQSHNEQSQSTKKQGQQQSASKPAGQDKSQQQAGYSPVPEQQEVKREQENMHSERKLGDIDVDKEEAKPQEADRPAGKAGFKTSKKK